MEVRVGNSRGWLRSLLKSQALRHPIVERKMCCAGIARRRGDDNQQVFTSIVRARAREATSPFDSVTC